MNTKRSRRKSRGTKIGPTARNDIPARSKHTYETASCPLPTVSDSTVVRCNGQSTIAAQAGSATTSSLNFNLNQTSLTAGYWDQYKLLAVRFTIVPDQNAVGLFANATVSFTPLYCVIDYDDTNALGSTAAAVAYSNCIVLGAGESCERLFKPRMALGAYSGAFSSFANVEDLWIDAASTTVQHYGVKLYIPAATAGQTSLPSWQIKTEYFFAFRKSI